MKIDPVVDWQGEERPDIACVLQHIRRFVAHCIGPCGVFLDFAIRVIESPKKGDFWNDFPIKVRFKALEHHLINIGHNTERPERPRKEAEILPIFVNSMKNGSVERQISAQ